MERGLGYTSTKVNNDNFKPCAPVPRPGSYDEGFQFETKLINPRKRAKEFEKLAKENKERWEEFRKGTYQRREEFLAQFAHLRD